MCGLYYSGVTELTVSSIPPPSRPSLAPDVPVTQQQQLAAVEAQLPLLSCQSQHVPTAAGPMPTTPAGQVAVQGVCQQQPGYISTEVGLSAALTSSSNGGGAGVQQPMECGDVPVVEFLSNVMGSLAYVVAPDSTVFLKRGEGSFQQEVHSHNGG